MDYELEVFFIPEEDDIPGRWAYRVGGVLQTWMPDVEGFVPMTEAEAQANAEVVLSRLVS